MRAKSDVDCAKTKDTSDRRNWKHPPSLRPAYASLAQSVRAADASWPFLTPAKQHLYTRIIRIRMMQIMADIHTKGATDDREETFNCWRSLPRAWVCPIPSSAERRRSCREARAQQANPEPGKENIKPANCNCYISPGTDFTHCCPGMIPH
jgi:hypothetical protein